MKNKPVIEFAKTISGIFSNKEQALENPKRFAHIQIHFRPLFLREFKSYTFYSEQRYQHDIWSPYRQSINKLSQRKDIFIVSNHKIKNKERFTGGAFDISLLDGIYKEELQERYGCSMHFIETNPGYFIGSVEPGDKCYIKKGKIKTYIKSSVKLNKSSLISEDSGHDEETGQKLWGSNFGPLVFKKIENFDKFIENNWE
tara:strand:- start:3097 stop:3696 length:600 start_codon:yes stop_codon:yes gene_type:complete